MITQSELKKILRYDSESGIFTWIGCNKHHSEKNSTIAGCEASGYIKIKIDGKKYSAHRLAWLYVYGEPPNKVIDHIDGDGLNNRIDNLRDCTMQQNNMNHRKKINNSGLPCGVRKTDSGYQARIGHLNQQHVLGTFSTVDEAEEAYLNKKRELFGEYCHVDM